MRRNVKKIGAAVTLLAMLASPFASVVDVMAVPDKDADVNIAMEDDPDPFTIAPEDAQDYNTDKLELTEGITYNGKQVTGAIDTMCFIADPTCIEVDGRIYMYGTLDQRSYTNEFNMKEGDPNEGAAQNYKNDPANGKLVKNKYQTKKLGIYSTTDLVNWTDEGYIDMEQVKGDDGAAASSKWAWNSWAPSAMICDSDKDGKDEYYIFLTNGGNIGYVKGETPLGPWKDELGKLLIDKSDIPNNENIMWNFDPSVLMDTDGNAYIYWGGGGSSAHPKSSRACRLKISADKVELDWDTLTELDSYFHFEDNEINKFQDKYVYSYCANWHVGNDPYITGGSVSVNAFISDDPLDITCDPKNPGDSQAQFIGTILSNPGAELFDEWYNNHHHMFEFKDKYYMLYHTTALDQFLYKDFYASDENKDKNRKSMDYRNMHIDELQVDLDGSDPKITMQVTYEGVAQTDDFNPYQKIKATTYSYQGGLTRKVLADGTPVVDKIDTGDWLKISGVNFGEKGASKVAASVASTTDEAMIDIFLDDPKAADKKVATLQVKKTGADKYETIESELSGVTGKHDVYFVLRGTGYNIATWEFTSADASGSEEPVGPQETTAPTPTETPAAAAPAPTTAPAATAPAATVAPAPTATPAADDKDDEITIGKPVIKSVKNVKGKKAQVTLKKKVSGASGYEIRYSLKSNMKSAKKVQIKKAATLSATIKGLAKKTYYIQARAYATVDGKKQYSDWSGKKKVKITK